MANPTGPAHRSVANVRSPTQPGAISPHTPIRAISSANYGSPSALRAEEECVVLELGSRYLRAGFAGDALPKAVIEFGPEEQRRAGDLRRWMIEQEPPKESHVQQNGWGEPHELWKPDVRGLDLGLVGDKLDRAVREAFTKYLLIDSRPRRMLIAVPSALPLPLLSTILDTLFTNFQPPTISLISPPVLTAVAAGLRSALVVDIGWAETVVTGVYEYREVQCTRSIRGMKILGESTFKMLAEAIDLVGTGDKLKDEELPSFDECEEVSARMSWCKPAKKAQPKPVRRGLTPVKEEDESRSSVRDMRTSEKIDEDAIVSVPLTSTKPRRTLQLSFSDLAEPCEKALFAAGTPERELDDEELPLHLLVYRSLLQLPVDVRSICMSRVIFVGGGSRILGLKGRVLDEVTSLIDQRGWDPVSGHAVDQLHSNTKLQRTRPRQDGPTDVLYYNDENPVFPSVSADMQEQERDPIEDQLKREASKGMPATTSGYLRAVDSLGAWSGGSLISQHKIPAISLVEREQWLQQGISGATRPAEVNITSQRHSMGPGALRTGTGDRSSWTLGLWG
ncbi:actin-related protein RO7 [Diplocarpon rosae]|nr:actin-related protein RO7 [Diplocarpon rosae]